MEYSLPGPVVALLQEENASISPKAYFISSGKKSIKITLVYAKDHHRSAHSDVEATTSAAECVHRKKPRHGVPPKHVKKTSSGPKRQNVKNPPESAPPHLHRNDLSSGNSSSLSDAEHVCSTPEFNMGTPQGCQRSHMSTVDSGHPPSSHPSSSGSNGSNRQVDENGSGSESEGERERGERECESVCSSDSEKPRTPCRDIALPESSLGPGETPAASREEMWQTWTRIPRSQAVMARKFLAAPSLAPNRRSLSPSVNNIPRNTTAASSQRRPRLQEGMSWDGSGFL